MTNKVILATDGSIPSLVATTKSVTFARDNKANLIAVTVTEEIPLTTLEKIAENVALGRKDFIDPLRFASAVAQEAGVSIDLQSRRGPVAGEIVQLAKETGADLVVIGRSNLRGLDSVILGDVTEAVIHMAPCSVWVIKPTEAEINAVLEKVKLLKAHEMERPVISAVMDSRKFRMSLSLFALYGAAYGAFTIIGTFYKDVMRMKFISINVAIVAGILIILAAITIAVFYNWYSVRLEKEPGEA